VLASIGSGVACELCVLVDCVATSAFRFLPSVPHPLFAPRSAPTTLRITNRIRFTRSYNAAPRIHRRALRDQGGTLCGGVWRRKRLPLLNHRLSARHAHLASFLDAQWRSIEGPSQGHGCPARDGVGFGETAARAKNSRADSPPSPSPLFPLFPLSLNDGRKTRQRIRRPRAAWSSARPPRTSRRRRSTCWTLRS